MLDCVVRLYHLNNQNLLSQEVDVRTPMGRVHESQDL
jgi:hypothetical protein